MVMTGDWNGGERVFRLGTGPGDRARRDARIDPATGAVREMKEGDLDDVDRYAWFSASMLRWRARRRRRMPHVRPHRDRVRPGLLALRRAADVRATPACSPTTSPSPTATGVDRVAHGHARDRPGLAVDGPQERTDRGGTARARRRLRGAAAARVRRAGPARGSACSARAGSACCWRSRLVPLLLVVQFLASEWIRGRFAPLTPRAAADPGWLEAEPAPPSGRGHRRRLGPWRGAGRGGGGRSRASRPRASSQTRVDGADLADEAEGRSRHARRTTSSTLVDGFFFDGRRQDEHVDVRAHYKTTGFDPTAKIRPGLEARVPSPRRPAAAPLAAPLPPHAAGFLGRDVPALGASGTPRTGSSASSSSSCRPLLLIGASAGRWRRPGAVASTGASGHAGVPGPAALMLLAVAAVAVTGLTAVP